MNCEETEEGSCKCKKCKKGFYEENYLCRNCIENCDVCSNNTKCEHCSANYFINTEGVCSKCPTNCKESTKKKNFDYKKKNNSVIYLNITNFRNINPIITNISKNTRISTINFIN